MSATIATPHASCSYAGLYSPTLLGAIPTLPFNTLLRRSRLGVGGLRAALDDGYVPHAISGENDKATTMADANLAEPNYACSAGLEPARRPAARVANIAVALAISLRPQ